MIGYQSMQDGFVLPARDYKYILQEKDFCWCFLSHIINPLLTKLVQSIWLDIALVLVDSVSVNRQVKKELG